MKWLPQSNSPPPPHAASLPHPRPHSPAHRGGQIRRTGGPSLGREWGRPRGGLRRPPAAAGLAEERGPPAEPPPPPRGRFGGPPPAARGGPREWRKDAGCGGGGLFDGASH